MARGKLIVFEGLDRAGKTTQCQRLVEALRGEGRDVKFMRFPDRTTPIGQMINSYLAGDSEQEDHAIHLLFSANRWEAVPTILTAIAQGTTVVIDRYYYSGIVYSAAKQNPSMSLSWCRRPDVGLPRPDLVLFLHIAPEEAAARGGFGVERYEKSEMQERVRGLFEEVGAREKGWVVVDAGKGMDEVQESIQEKVKERMREVDEERAPLGVVEEW
ncbi:thymidylate kinase-domain-containing protein [Boeremia exigua]|uniref:thymidylate kinase-domain-containing protein n=1 Tax=Boeremia exigua TaxID=749465 RepID=UPI001E8E7F14|nr:thymidylate kinase-domain-containing protein [Boeremia exigua]KAH6638965.1 thymidylate kinase-domain-containing protein [Boeremia exigua]